MAFTIGLDIGTTSIKAIVFDTERGLIISSIKKPTPVTHPTPEFSEHDPEFLWRTIADCILETSTGYQISGISVSSFAEAGLPLDKHMQPLYPIIAWFDQRSLPQLDTLHKQISDKEIFRITGQKAGFSFGLLKLLWVKANFPEVFDNLRWWLSVPDYILFRLSGQITTDYTQASRTLMYDQSTQKWSPQILSIAGISENMLPEIKSSGTQIGQVTKSAAELTGLSEGTPCVLGGHDHLCGAFACGSTKPGDFIDSMGTSQAVIALTDRFDPSDTLLDQGYVNYAHVVPDIYLIKGGLKAGGKAIEWSKNVFKSIDQDFNNSFEPGKVKDLPFWLPYLHGSGTPNRQASARAVLFGLDSTHTNHEIYLALLEGFAFWLRENVDSISTITGKKPEKIIAIGGTNQNKFLLDIKAAALNIPINVPTTPEAAAVGAALLAAIGCKITQTYAGAAALNRYPINEIEPQPAFVEILADRYTNGYLPLRRSLSPLQKELYK